MKKTTLILALAATIFAACGKDNEATNTNMDPVFIPGQLNPASVSMEFRLNATDDMLRFLDFTVTYDDGTGEREDTVTSSSWVKTFTSSLPATFTFKRHIRVKEGMYDALAAIDTVQFARGYGYVYYIFDSDATPIPSMDYSHYEYATDAGPGSGVADLCQRGRLDYTYTFEFDAYGRCTPNIR